MARITVDYRRNKVELKLTSLCVWKRAGLFQTDPTGDSNHFHSESLKFMYKSLDCPYRYVSGEYTGVN